MKIDNRLVLIPTADIKIASARQRRTEPHTPNECFANALSIARVGLLQNIGVTQDNTLIFGEGRLTMFRMLAGDHTGLSTEQSSQLTEAAAAATQRYGEWTIIPARVLKDTTALDVASIEFIENVGRRDLPLQDRQRAAWEIHKACVDAAKKRNMALPPDASPERWTDAQTAALLGIHFSYFSHLIAPLRAIENAPPALRPQLEQVVAKAPTTKSAKSAVNAVLERHGEKQGLTLDLPSATTIPRRQASSQTKLDIPIICADFTKWAPTYDGEPFTFLHCDFPYGIKYNSSNAMRTSVATDLIGNYDDSAEVYWTLLETLAANRDRLLAPSAHIMFWLSQNWRRETEDFFAQRWPDAVVSKFLLIWHCSDNSGLMPTPREGRRNMETALQITLGDRPLAAQKSMVFSYPRSSDTKVHRSQKPIPVLEHFMPMYVDSSSRVLDPTCGSGTSQIVAARLGAKYTLGIEIDPVAQQTATEFWLENVK